MRVELVEVPLGVAAGMTALGSGEAAIFREASTLLVILVHELA